MFPLAAFLAQEVSSSEPMSLSPFIISWVFLGLVLGFVGNNFLTRESKVSPVGVLAGLLGSILGGVIFYLINRDASFGINVAVAATAAIVLMLVYHRIVVPAMA